MTARAALRAGAASGLVAWAVYAVVETWFCSLLPRLTQPGFAYTPVHPGFTALTFLLYPLLGVLAGGVLGLALQRGARLAGALSVLVAFDLNLLHLVLLSRASFEASVLHLLQPLAVSILPAAAIVASLTSEERARRLRFLTSPWTIAVLLVGLPWTTLQLLASAGPREKALALVAFPGAVLLLAALLARVFPRRGGAWGGLALVALALGTLGVSVTLRAVPEARGGAAPVPPGSAGRPDVVLIVMDTVRADHTSLYGYGRDTTPELRRLADGATRYARCLSASDLTLTTHASLFTGLYGRQHGAHRSDATPAGRPLSRSAETMAEMLSAHGYWTAALVANRGYVSPHFGFDQGFRLFDSRAPVVLLAPPPAYLLRRPLRAALAPLVPRAERDRVTRTAGEIHEEAFAFLDAARARGGPFFLFLNYMDAHNPFVPPAPYDTMFPGKDDSFTSKRYAELLREVMRHGSVELPERERLHLVSQYDGGIAYEDAEIAGLIARLKEAGRWENTLFIVTSDHGEAFGERSLLNHGVSVYRDQVDVPLLVRYPGQSEGRTTPDAVGTVDLLPTVLDVVGLPVPGGLPGRSLRSDPPAAPRALVAESFPAGKDSGFDRTERALLLGRYKLIVSSDGRRELYDVEADPDETTDLSAREIGITAGLEEELTRWLEATAVGSDSSAASALDPEARERLRALGYVE